MGVGSAAIQLAKVRGARVIGVAGASKQQSVADAGADLTLIRGSNLEVALGNDSVDVVIDLVGGEDWPDCPIFFGLLGAMRSLVQSRDPSFNLI